MNIATTLMGVVLLITVLSPIGVYYGATLARRKNFKAHRKVQNMLFTLGLISVLSLEGLIRATGGSGSLASQSQHYGSPFFSGMLASHILIAVITFITWATLVVLSNRKFRKTLPGRFSSLHKKLGYGVFIGLVYTAITALLIFLMTLNFI